MDCLDCSKYLTCRDKKKAKNYRCEKFTKKTLRDISEILSISSVLDEHGNDEIDMSDVEGENKKKRDPGFTFADEKTNVSELIESVINSDLLTPIDTKIDDSAAPSAKNFYEFTTGQHFLNVKPYAFQMLYITQLFAEYCPRCSDTKWMREGIKVDDSLALFYEKVKLLEFGICPKCGATKSQLVKEGELNFYQELAGLAGQRCIAGESVIFTDTGMVHVEELDNGFDLDFEFNEIESFILNGDFDIVPNHAIYKCYPEETYRVELENGIWIEGTKEHPIYTSNGYVPIIMSEGELVPVRFDFEAFGKERLPLHVAKFLGYWTACGNTCSLQTTNADAFESTKALFPQAFKIEDQIIFDYTHSYSRMEEILGYGPNMVKEKRSVPKCVRESDRASVLVFLQAFFAEAYYVSNDTVTVNCSSKRIQLSIASYLQMFGVRYLLKDLSIIIDGESNQLFTRTFNLPRVPNTVSEYDSYEYNEEEDVYWIPVKSITRSFVQITYDFIVPGTHDFVANGIINHNSGKSAITAMSCAYLLHKQLKLQKPNEVYGLLPANVLHGTFVALTYKQAAETLWEPFLAYVTDSPWFNLYHDILDHYNKKYNDEFYKVKDTFITYKARRLLLYPAGPNKKTLRGRTRFLSCIDEIGWFDNNRDEGKVKMDANEVYVALDRSLLTVRSSANRLIRQGFDDIPNGYAFNVSSPSSARDKIVELVTQSRTSRKILGFKRATWEMNPNITKDDLSEEFAKDPQAAERDYGCNPPLSDNAFFSSFAAVEGCFVGKPNKLKYSYAQRKAKDGSITRYAKIDDVSKSTKPNVLAIDSGYSNNSFSLVCGHLHEGIPILTCFCEVMPNPGMPLNHALIFRELVLPLIKERNVKVLISDRWQNIKLLQDAEMEYEDLITISYSLKYDDFWVIKQSMFDSEVVFPKLKRSIEDILKYDQSKYPFCFTDPIEHLALQVMTVRDMGNTVDKGDSLTDDTFRACCLAIHALNDEELFEIFNGEGMEEVKSKAALGHMIAKSSGGTGKSGEVAVSSSGKAIGVAISRR